MIPDAIVEKHAEALTKFTGCFAAASGYCVEHSRPVTEAGCAFMLEQSRAALEAVYADIKAEALREAADAWAAYIKAMGYGTTGPIDFLQRRADQIGGQP